jgi:hypothetical protein
MQNIKQLRNSLIDNYNQTKKGEMPIPLCKELNNAAGKILTSCKVEIEYKKFIGDNNKIKFLEQ